VEHLLRHLLKKADKVVICCKDEFTEVMAGFQAKGGKDGAGADQDISRILPLREGMGMSGSTAGER
jgi:hypothetical protein